MGAGRAAAARIISRVKISADLRSPRRRHTVANDQLALGRGATGSVSARSGALRKPPGHPWTPAPPRAAPRAAEKPHRCSTPAARAAQSQMHVDAGRHAAVAAWPMLHAAGLDTALVELPTGTDPAEVPAQVLRHAIHTAQPLADLVIDHTLSAWPERTRWGRAHRRRQPGRRPHHRHPSTRADGPASHPRRNRPAHPHRSRHHSSHRRRHPAQHPQRCSGQRQRRLAPAAGNTPPRASLLTQQARPPGSSCGERDKCAANGRCRPPRRPC